MEMYIGIKIEKIDCRIKLASGRTDNILAFGEVWFYEQDVAEPIIKVRGFMIKKKEFGEKKVIAVDFPAYGSPKSHSGYQTSFILENHSLLEDVRRIFLEDYGRLSKSESSVLADEVEEGLKKEGIL